MKKCVLKNFVKYTILEFQFQSVKCTVVTKLRKNFEHLFILIQIKKTIKVCWCKQSTSKSFRTFLCYIYLFKLYDKSIIILLTNNLTKIWSKISKVRLILWMVYACNVKGLEEAGKLGRDECTLHRWPRSLEMSDSIGPYQ